MLSTVFPFVISGSSQTEVYVGGLEEIGVADAINTMLLATTSARPGGDATAGVLRLFPVWKISGGGNASFSKLLAKGGFEVSASFNNDTGLVGDVSITARADARCAVLSPWASLGARVRVTSGAVSVPLEWGKNGDGVFAFDVHAGSVYEIAEGAD